jgi:hypothetical protein
MKLTRTRVAKKGKTTTGARRIAMTVMKGKRGVGRRAAE